MHTSTRLYANEFTFDKRSCRKWNIYQKLRNSTRNTFSFIPHVSYFSYLPWIAASEGRNLTTLFSTKMRGKEIATKTSTSLFHSIKVSPILPSPPLCKNHNKPEADKKIQTCLKLTLNEGFIFCSYRCSKRSVSRLLTLN